MREKHIFPMISTYSRQQSRRKRVSSNRLLEPSPSFSSVSASPSLEWPLLALRVVVTASSRLLVLPFFLLSSVALLPEGLASLS
jgi:hypothetical protein